MKTLLTLLLLIPSLSFADIFACSYKSLGGAEQIVNIIIEKQGKNYLMSPRDLKLLKSEDDKSIRFVNYQDLGGIYSIVLNKESMRGQVANVNSCSEFYSIGLCPNVRVELISCTHKN